MRQSRSAFGADKHGPVLCLAAVLLALLVLPAHAENDQASVESVKAGFVYNFVKLTVWPPTEGSTGSLRLCTLGRGVLNGQLGRLQGRIVGGRDIQILERSVAKDWASCHIVFVSKEDGERVAEMLKQTAGVPVLTIGDVPDFAQQGGMIELIERENKVRFSISLAAAQRSGIRLSSQLLKLAVRVWQ